MKLLASCAVAAALIANTAAATGLPSRTFDIYVWAATVLKKNGVEDARVVDVAFPISFTYCPKNSPALWRYQAINATQLEALNRGDEVPVNAGQNYELVEAHSASCSIAQS